MKIWIYIQTHERLGRECRRKQTSKVKQHIAQKEREYSDNNKERKIYNTK